MRMLAFAATLVAGMFIFPGLALAQAPPVDVPHTASPTAIALALQQPTADADAQRTRVRELLQRPEIQQLAGQLGLDLRHAEAAVGTLEGQQLTEVSAQAD